MDARVDAGRVDRVGLGGRATDALLILSLTGIWVLCAALVDPKGDFPLSDDWSYGRTVKILIEEHRFYLDGWTNATFSLQALWGALFCLPFGFSFTALRISTLVMGAVGGAGLYFLLREVAVRRSWALVGSLALLLNPVYFLNSFTFMTDVPFTALVIVSSLLLLRAIRRDSVAFEIAGVAVLCCALMVRQTAVPIAVAYGLAKLVSLAKPGRALLRAMWPAVCAAVLLSCYGLLMARMGVTPEMHDSKQREIAFRFAMLGGAHYAEFVARNAYAFVANLCVFALPVTVLLVWPAIQRWLANRKSGHGSKAWLAVLSVSAAAMLAYLSVNFFFIFGDSLNPSMTLGPCDIYFCQVMHASYGAPILVSLSTLVAYLAILLMSWLVAAPIIAHAPGSSWCTAADLKTTVFALGASIGMSVPFFFFRGFDRYMVPVLPFVLVLALLGSRLAESAAAPGLIWRNCAGTNVAGSLAGLVLVVMGAVSVTGTHDYLQWNRARWRAVSELRARDGIPADAIDGGFPVSGWNLYLVDNGLRQRWHHWYTSPASLFRPEAQYIVAFAVKGLGRSCVGQQVGSYPFTAWTLPGTLEIAAFRRWSASNVPAECLVGGR